MHYLALDPGHATGYACWDRNGKLLDFGTMRTPVAYFNYLQSIEEPPKVIIMEEFKLFQHKALQQSGSDMIASQIIGATLYYAHINNIKTIVYQPANIKKIAAMWSGKPAPSNHKESHAIDAYNHGYYYLQKNRIIKPHSDKAVVDAS